jgi:hypothetical protein
VGSWAEEGKVIDAMIHSEERALSRRRMQCAATDHKVLWFQGDVYRTYEAIGTAIDKVIEEPPIVPGMRVRWTDPDDGACTREGIVKTCTAPEGSDELTLTTTDGWQCGCLRGELEILDA